MNTYTPDAWVILRIQAGEQIIHKVMGGWYGGFANPDTWRLNSGITRIEQDDKGGYRIHGYSGSVYEVHKDTQRATLLMGQVIEGLRQQADVQIVDVEAVL